MGALLTDADEYIHPLGSASNWNESRYIDFWDSTRRIGGWFRIGMRPNEKHAEMSSCINLPDGRTAFMFGRPEISKNGLEAAGQRWLIGTPWDTTVVTYHGPVIILDDAWRLTDPKKAFNECPKVDAAIELTTYARGLSSIMGFDQDHIDRIFLPGQADFHYQHLIRTAGRVRIGDFQSEVSGAAAKITPGGRAIGTRKSICAGSSLRSTTTPDSFWSAQSGRQRKRAAVSHGAQGSSLSSMISKC